MGIEWIITIAMISIGGFVFAILKSNCCAINKPTTSEKIQKEIEEYFDRKNKEL